MNYNNRMGKGMLNNMGKRYEAKERAHVPHVLSKVGRSTHRERSCNPNAPGVPGQMGTDFKALIAKQFGNTTIDTSHLPTIDVSSIDFDEILRLLQEKITSGKMQPMIEVDVSMRRAA